ncbi:carcinoembryonic antigen-related cell adhesion molecule 5-like isoform X1 [Carlito syrichta]|uniref:Carcinoembryonic antigen-related cell adhesion molecule 5-like isoform X1 n=1 Tax=Carlito syrichta TaxID=1868482 RepID=A0A3Q0DWP9_CARSF|nr:carcinoembryonic antigen-related cell adhesion molecule 5-like isoform X1 [Carlito syrichta]
MVPPSNPHHRGCIPWQELLLTVSLLTFWNPPTTAQLAVESMPSNVAEGKDVLLLAHNLPQDHIGYKWFKGRTLDGNHRIATYVIDSKAQTPGPAYSGRETIYHNGSLLFRNVAEQDTGSYTLEILKKNLDNEQGTGQFHVQLELPKPTITSNNSSPLEDKDSVVLTCEPETQDTTYLWRINGQSLQVSPGLQLSKDNRTLTLFSVTRNDPGPYECETQNPVSARRSDPFTLNVLYGPNTPTISPPDSHYHSGANLRLTCYTVSNPPAQYSWLIDGKLKQSTQELFISKITKKNSGSYTCLVRNSATGHNRTTVMMITVSVELPEPSITSSNSNPVEDKDSVTLTCEPETQDTTYLWWINGQSLPVSSRLKLSKDNRTLTLLSVTRIDSGSYECEMQNPDNARRSDPVTLNILYGPDTPTIYPPDSSYSSGTDLRLSCYAASNPPAQYSWHIDGMPQQFTHELFIFSITTKNSGTYTCLAHNSATGYERTTDRKITVSAELPKPSITSNNSSPVENKNSVALTCEPETQDTVYLWWINGQSFPVSPRLELSKNNRTLTLLNVTRNDAGPYECGNQNPVSRNRSDPVTLNVLYGPDAPTISPPDSTYRPGANLNLSCHADSNPPAQYSWFINGSFLQSTQVLFIPNINVNNGGSYTCLANNSATGNNRTTVKIIAVSDLSQGSSPGLSAGAIVGIVIGVLGGVALIAALVYFLHFRKTGRASDQRDLTEHKPSASNHIQGHSDNSPNKPDEVAYSSLDFKAQQQTQPTSATPSSKVTETIYSEVKKN